MIIDQLFERLQRDKRHQFVAFLVGLCTVLYSSGFGVITIIVIGTSTTFGIAFAKWVFGASNGDMFNMWSTVFRSEWNSVKKPININADARNDEKHREMPWTGILADAALNDSLETFLNEVVEKYVNEWYGDSISRDRAFLNEIRYQLRFASASFVRAFGRMDITDYLTKDVIPTIMFHTTRMTEMIKEERGTDEKSNAMPRSMIESKIAHKLTDVHFALTSRENESEYVRQIAEFLLPRILDETRLSGKAHDDDTPQDVFGSKKNRRPWPSKSIRIFLREIFSNTILLPILDTLSQPDTINYWLILLFDDVGDPKHASNGENLQVPLLTNFAGDSPTNVPDSLLQLKLSEILRDNRLYSIFRMYLQDIRGPVHELQFLSEASRIHEAIQRKTDSSSQVAYDVWQLYGQFVHESSHERVELLPAIAEQFKCAVSSSDLTSLDQIIETSYQIVYNRMQSEQVVSFCQSDCFLGHLCGSPPITINELIDRDAQEKRKHAVQKTFSLSQLRNRVRKALTSFSDEEEDEKEKIITEIHSNSHDEINSPESQSSFSSFVNVPSIDISEDDEKESSPQPTKDNAGLLLIDSDSPKELNSWKVNVTRVVPLKDAYNDTVIYVFVIDVERSDARPHETKHWEIHRSFNEFYVLESKLNEFHGDALRFAPLPQRKTFVTRDRPYMEQHRMIFSTFLSSLCKQKLLNRSELLFSFLSSNDEFRGTILLSDLNPWKVVKQMPSKLSREKGQNLQPFLLKILANVLAPNAKIINDALKTPKKHEETTSFDLSMGIRPDSLATNTIYSSVYGSNFDGIVPFESVRSNSIESVPRQWTTSPLDSIIFFLWSSFKSHSTWAVNCIAAIRSLCRSTIDTALHYILGNIFQRCLNAENLVAMVQHLQYSLFCDYDQPWPTEKEKEMREELAKRRTQEYFQNIINSRAERVIGREHIKEIIGTAIEVFQYPRMNKQLAYVLLDQLLLRIFKDLQQEDTHPLQ